jgi:molecular chaperone GrpE (heat shock protein)
MNDHQGKNNESRELDKENAAHMAEREIRSQPEAQNGAEEQAAELQKKIAELQNDLALARADFYNYRQRAEKEKNRMRASISEDRVLDFIPVLDNLDRALNVSEDSSASDVLKGVKMVQKQFLSVLQEIGVEAIYLEENLSEFDHLLHDAVGTEEVVDPNLDRKIVQELLKGYRTKEKVLRPSQVKVGKFTSAPTKSNQ